MSVDRLRWLQLAAWVGLIAVFFVLAVQAYAPGLAALGTLLIAVCVVLQFVLEGKATGQAYDDAYSHWNARYGREQRAEVRTVEPRARVRRAN